jgi:hypothetical protein
MAADHLTTTVRSPTNRSRITNGRRLLPGVDGRSAPARRYQDIVASLVSDAGGNAEMSEARRQLIRRFAALAVCAEALEAKLANGEAIDLAEHCTISSTLVRLAHRLGLNRHAKMIPSLADYLASPEFRNSLPADDPGSERADGPVAP